MFFHNIQFVTVAIAAIVSTVIGFLWYSPWIFGKIWMREMGITDASVEEFKKNASAMTKVRMYAAPLALSLVTSFIVAALLNSLIVTSISGLVIFGVSVWAGFSMPVAANNAIFGKDNLVLFALNAGFQLVNLIAVALIIGIWG